jgi:glucarate dehydratase
MIIREVRVTPVAFRDPPLLLNAGVHEPWALRSIVEVRCGDGVVGLGESYGDAEHLALLEAAARSIVGLDVFDLVTLRRRVGAAVAGDPGDPAPGAPSPDPPPAGAADRSPEAACGDRPGGPGAPLKDSLKDPLSMAGGRRPLRTRPAAVFSPFEVACLDAAGQATGRPVCDLLGGAARASVPFSAYLFYKWAGHPGQDPDAWGAALDPDQLVAQARRMVDTYGFGSLKLKGGVFPPEEEIEAVRALRAAFPDHPIRIDPNGAWRPGTSVRVAQALDGVLEYLEDPTPGRAGMAEVAARAPMPLATNMCVVGFGDLPEAVRLGSVGVVLADHHYWGGLRACQALAAMCTTFGLEVSMHSNSHLGISLAAMVHLAAATPALGYACDTHRPWQDDDVVAGGGLSFQAGAVTVPRVPGLGVELDRDALARMHRAYLDCGLRRRDDAAYMRTVRPGFTPHRARW